MKKIFSVAILSLFSLPSFAVFTTAKIDRILFYEQSNLIYIFPEGGVQNPPACHGSNGDYYSYKLSRPMAKEYVSALMSAMYAKKTVTFRHYNDCIDQSVSVTLRYFIIKAG
ncbi:hypothetical protein [Kangiella sp. TOML190]|uniref:hypothetical protein n=1 Tax=Kangiella sp. TOML190 TaxID=2931351 RepID=UPI00203D3BA2|nr:hypothetical protein [Kangiella sp. TOML190]